MFENNPFATHTLEILLMLFGAAFIGLWLGWVLWGRLKEELERLKVDNQSFNATTEAIRLEMDSLKSRAVEAESDSRNYETQVQNLHRECTNLVEKVTDAENELAQVQTRNRQLETQLGLSFSADTRIANDIPLEIKETALETSVFAEPVEVPFEIHPTEPEDEDLPAEPEMSEPDALDPEPIAMLDPMPETLAEEESMMAADEKPDPALFEDKDDLVDLNWDHEVTPPPAHSAERDDLTVIEGIGPKIQMLLNQYNISTYRHLAEVDVKHLKEILANAGSQLAMHDPGTWPSQANLAANDQWDTLKSVQGFLKGGKKQD